MKKSQLRKIIRESIREQLGRENRPNFPPERISPERISPTIPTINQPGIRGKNQTGDVVTTNMGLQCNVTPAGQCAQTWFGPIATNMTNFMANKACTGQYTFQGAYNSAYNQFTDFTNTYPANSQLYFQNIENSTNWYDINSSVNSYALAVNQTSGIAMPGMEKGQMKRAYAKTQWAECIMAPNRCNCMGPNDPNDPDDPGI
tara:strand:- start:81 stop:686 length:606 start_codon:yes stop_codon:yes gene_type:complete